MGTPRIADGRRGAARLVGAVVFAVLIASVGCGRNRGSGADPAAGQLDEAIRAGDLERVGTIVARSPGAVRFVGDRGVTPLHWAASLPTPEIAQVLLQAGAPVDVRDQTNGFTPLHWAARDGRMLSVRALCERHAEVDARGRSGQTPLHLATEGNQNGALGELLRFHADPNIRLPSGLTPLRIARVRGMHGVAATLEAHGAID